MGRTVYCKQFARKGAMMLCAKAQNHTDPCDYSRKNSSSLIVPSKSPMAPAAPTAPTAAPTAAPADPSTAPPLEEGAEAILKRVEDAPTPEPPADSPPSGARASAPSGAS